MDIRDVGYEGMYWINLTSDKVPWWAVGNTVMNLQVP